ncbi:MAG: RidA family protein [Thermomicrobiales bacterium]
MADMPIAAGAQGSVRYFNPDGLIDDPAFTEVVEVGGPARTIYIGMQHALTASRTMVGKGDLAAQTEQVLKNVELGLAAADAKPEHLVLLRMYVVEGQKLQQALEVFQKWWGDRPNPPTDSVLFVTSLREPDFLIGIEAIAAVSQSGQM